MKLAKLYDGPYRVEAYLPGFRTMRLVRMRSGTNPGGEIRLAHVDNVKPFHPSYKTRPDTVYEVADPSLSTNQEHRIVDQLERAASMAAAALGAPRARAIVAHAMGQTDLTPLPPQLQQLLPHPNGPPSSPSLPSPHPPSTPAPPPPPQPEVPLAVSWQRDDRPWHLPPVAPPSPSQLLGYSTRGRTLRKPQSLYTAPVQCSITTTPGPGSAESSTSPSMGHYGFFR